MIPLIDFFFFYSKHSYCLFDTIFWLWKHEMRFRWNREDWWTYDGISGELIYNVYKQ